MIVPSLQFGNLLPGGHFEHPVIGEHCSWQSEQSVIKPLLEGNLSIQ